MATPLQAQMMANQVAQAQQARQALRANPVGGVQAAAPANANALMAMRNQQVPNIQKTQGPASRLQEVDKIKYQEALKQQQFKEDALRRRDNLLNRQTIALEAQKQENAMQELAQRHSNALEVTQVGQQNAKDLEGFKLKIEEDKRRMNYNLADEKYGPLRNYVSTIFADFDNWLTKGKAEFENARREQLQLDTAKIAGITPEMIQTAYNKDVGKGIVAQATLQIGSALYNKYARKILMSGAYDTQIAQINSQVQQESNQRTQQKSAMYKVASDKVMKLGFTLPGASGLPSPNNDTSGPRPKVDANALGDTSNLDDGEENPDDPPLAPESNYILKPLAEKAISTVEDMYQYIAENPGALARIGVATTVAGLSLDQFRRLGGDKLKEIQDKLNEEIDLEARTTDKPIMRREKVSPKKPFSRKTIEIEDPNNKGQKIKVNKEEYELKEEIEKAEKAGNKRKVNQLRNRLDDAYPTYRDVNTGKNVELSGAAKTVKARAVAPKQMMEYAKTLDPRGLGKKDIDFWKNADPKEFGAMISKSKGGLMKQLAKWGVDMAPKDVSGLKKIAGSKVAKIGGMVGVGLGLLDLITFSEALNDEQKQEALKKAKAIKEASEAHKASLLARIAELEAKAGQSEEPSGLQAAQERRDSNSDQPQPNMIASSLSKLIDGQFDPGKIDIVGRAGALGNAYSFQYRDGADYMNGRVLPDGTITDLKRGMVDEYGDLVNVEKIQ